MLSTANITMQFGPKPLFENISVKFGEGNRYGLIGANGCGKSTFMKILGGDLEPSSGTVMLDPHERLGKLRQDQFAFEEMRVTLEGKAHVERYTQALAHEFKAPLSAIRGSAELLAEEMPAAERAR